MPPIEYLTVTDVISLHDAIMDRMGQAPAPLRDKGLLESAIRRPRTAAYYEGADLVRQAALLAAGISQAQAFLDGNKRTAFAALDVFLTLNGIAVDADSIEFARQLEALAMRTDSLDQATSRFEAWLRDLIG